MAFKEILEAGCLDWKAVAEEKCNSVRHRIVMILILFHAASITILREVHVLIFKISTLFCNAS